MRMVYDHYGVKMGFHVSSMHHVFMVPAFGSQSRERHARTHLLFQSTNIVRSIKKWTYLSPFPSLQMPTRQDAIPVLDGRSMFDRGANGTRQSESVAAQLRGHRAWLTSAHTGDDGLGAAHWKSTPALGPGEVEVYPDTRMCLVWQKLQMLDCCRVRERGFGMTSGGVGFSKEGQEQQQHGEDEEDGDVFYDTREYDHPWEMEDDGKEQNQDGNDGDVVGRGVDDGPQPSVLRNSGEEEGLASYAAPSSGSIEGPLSRGAEEMSDLSSGIVAMGVVGRVEEDANSAGGDVAASPPMATVAGEGVVDSEACLPVTVGPGVARAVTVSGGDENLGVAASTDVTATGTSEKGNSSTDATGGDVSAGAKSEGFLQEEGVTVKDETPSVISPGAEAMTTEELGDADVTNTRIATSVDYMEAEPPATSAGVVTKLVTPSSGKGGGKGKGKPHLLRTGAAVRSPKLQSIGPVTGDMLEQQKLGQAWVYRERAVLRADMEAFLRENTGAVFADFVRWYRPECWKVLQSY